MNLRERRSCTFAVPAWSRGNSRGCASTREKGTAFTGHGAQLVVLVQRQFESEAHGPRDRDKGVWLRRFASSADNSHAIACAVIRPTSVASVAPRSCHGASTDARRARPRVRWRAPGADTETAAACRLRRAAPTVPGLTPAGTSPTRCPARRRSRRRTPAPAPPR